MKYDLEVLVPVKNEEDNVENLVARVNKCLSAYKINYQLIFIDDKSTDNTVPILTELAKKYPISIKTKEGKPGKGYSLIEGTRIATAEFVAFIDGDLQYPPEALPAMYEKAKQDNVGVVVANRDDYKSEPLRKYGSKANKFVFGKLLLKLNCDIQSGLKVYRREIFDHVTLHHIGPWTFDIPLLHTATELGYQIDQVNIEFRDRTQGASKVGFFKTALAIANVALKTKFSRNKVYNFDSESDQPSHLNSGVFYKKGKFTTHTGLPHHKSALYTVTRHQKVGLVLITILILFGLYFDALATVSFFIAVLSTIYFLDVLFSVYLIYKTLYLPPEITSTKEEIYSLNDDELPIYTILCPLYKEANILHHFVNAIDKLDWPKDKLDVQLLLEEDDSATINRAKELNLPDYFRVVVVPHSQPKTKPKACNYGLNIAKGDYVVIYDAEDKPDPFQLKKAYLAFKKLPEKVVCVQAKLNYYNPDHNFLTKMFTVEYSLWFDVILPGLQTVATTIPLGGTSNHFKTEKLKELHGWDPFNVTEDCDLGVRLFKEGYTTSIIESTTYEEANSNVKNWIRQRSRWIKGYFQTYLVHMRDPHVFFKDHGSHAFIFQLVIGLRISFMLINPFLWVATISYFVFYSYVGPTIEALYPTIVFYMAAFSLVFGNFLYVYNYMIGALKKNHPSLVKYVFFIPFYWFLMSIAACMAFYQLIFKPHYWEKTIHGLHLKPKKKNKSENDSSTTQEVEYEEEHEEFIHPESIEAKSIPARTTYFSWAIVQTALNNNLETFKSLLKRNKSTNNNNSNGLNILIYNWRDVSHKWAGGAEIYLHELAKRWVAEGNNVSIFCGNDGNQPSESHIDGINIYRKGGLYTVYLWAVIYYLLKFRGKYDIIVDSNNGLPFFTPLYSRAKKILIIYHMHGDVFKEHLWFPLSYISFIATFIESKVVPFIYRNQKIITISKSSKKDIVKHKYGKESDIEIVNPGINVETIGKVTRTRHPSFVYLGRLKPYKNVDVLIKSFSKLLETTPNAKLEIAGDGESRKYLEKLSEDLKITKSVTFHGKVSETQKAELFTKCWVAVQPSSFEGWGITVIEANSYKTPVIASDIKGLRDSVLHGQTGLLVDAKSIESFKNAMEIFAKDKELLKSMAENSYNWSKNFDWKVGSERFMASIKEHLGYDVTSIQPNSAEKKVKRFKKITIKGLSSI